jgi:exonuclease III
MDRSFRQKINNETVNLNNTIDKMDLTDIYRTFHTKAGKHTFFSSKQGIVSRIDHMQANLNKFKRTEIISTVFSNLNGVKV